LLTQFDTHKITFTQLDTPLYIHNYKHNNPQIYKHLYLGTKMSYIIKHKPRPIQIDTQNLGTHK